MTDNPLRQLLERLEVPDCGCPVKPMRECCRGSGHGCRDWNRKVCVTPEQPEGCKTLREQAFCGHRRSETCECPMTPGDPCIHVKTASVGWPKDPQSNRSLTHKAWAELLALAYPEEYAERPPPLEPAKALDRESRVDLKAWRRRRGLGLWHPGDLDPEEADKVGREQEMTDNGRPRDVGLGVLRLMSAVRKGGLWDEPTIRVRIAFLNRLETPTAEASAA